MGNIPYVKGKYLMGNIPNDLIGQANLEHAELARYSATKWNVSLQ